MIEPRQSSARMALMLSLMLAAGCGGASGGAPDTRADLDSSDASRGWHVVLRDLPSAVLSLWGPRAGELWLVGADVGDGTGPQVIHGTAEGFARLDLRAVDPAGGTLWWVTGFGADDVWMSGEGGRVFEHHPASGATRAVATGTDATLYGIWGASADELWAVGGYVYPRSGPPTVVRITRDGARVVTDLPAALDPSVTFFKVWGSAADDVWVVGERGQVLHWDGHAWTLRVLPGEPRLVTIHGRSASDFVAVGGTADAVIREGPDFADGHPGPWLLLNGVDVAADGSAWAVGMLAEVVRRDGGPGSGWSEVPDVPVYEDWHAVWVDARGDAWVVGGRLTSADALDQGALIRFGPTRDDLPAGPVAPIDAGDVDGDASDASDATTSDASDASEASDAETVETRDDDVDAVGDALVDSAVAPDVDDVAAAEVDASDALEVDAMDGGPCALGGLDPTSGDFVPYTAGQEAELVQGTQGLLHVWAVVEVPFDSELDPLTMRVSIHTVIAGSTVGHFVSAAYPTPHVGPGLYRTYPITVIFDGIDAALYEGFTATLEVEVEPTPGDVRRTSVEVVLVDRE